MQPSDHLHLLPSAFTPFLAESVPVSHSHYVDQPQDPLTRAVMQTSPAQTQARLAAAVLDDVASNPDADAILTARMHHSCEWMPGEVMALVFCFVDAKTLMVTIPSVWTPLIFYLSSFEPCVLSGCAWGMALDILRGWWRGLRSGIRAGCAGAYVGVAVTVPLSDR